MRVLTMTAATMSPTTAAVANAAATMTNTTASTHVHCAHT